MQKPTKTPLSQLPGFVPDLEGDEYDPIWFAKLFNGNASAFKRRLYEITKDAIEREEKEKLSHEE